MHTIYVEPERHTKHLELEKKFFVRPKTADLPVAHANDTVETLKIAKTQIEEQLKQAAALLADETKRRIAAETKLTEFAEYPARMKNLEEMNKRQRTTNDTLQQQMMLQVDKLSGLEKQLKQYRTEKLEYETKFEERVS
jgi:hypothetical protein